MRSTMEYNNGIVEANAIYKDDALLNLADSAICIFDEAHGNPELYNWLAQGEGIANVRDNCIYLAQEFNRAWEIASDEGQGYIDPFDFEFVPLLANWLIHNCKQISNIDRIVFDKFLVEHNFLVKG